MARIFPAKVGGGFMVPHTWPAAAALADYRGVAAL
jgi:hypothetical protein